MNNFPLKNSDPLSAPQLPLQKQPLPVGISQEQPHPRGIISRQTNHEQILPFYSSSSRQQLVLAPRHPPSPNDGHPLRRSHESSDHQQPNHHSPGIPARNLSYEEFILAEEGQRSSSEDPVTGFPNSWPNVSSSPPPPPPSPPASVITAPPLEPTSPEKGFSPPLRKAFPPLEPPSPANVPRNVPTPPPSPSRSCSCCIIL